MAVVIEDGTYEIILSEKSTDGKWLALDVNNAKDRSGENVDAHYRNKSDAQRWTVTNYDNGVQITNPMTGRCLDLANNNLKNGANIRQWEDNNSHAQRWDIVDSGNTVTIDGTSYKAYAILSHNTNYCVDTVDHVGSVRKIVSHANVHLWDYGAVGDQQWCFIPIENFNQIGVYKILSALSENYAIDLSGNSSANGANIQLYPDNDTAAQRWIVYPNDDTKHSGTAGSIKILHAQHIKDMCVTGDSAKSDSNVHLWNSNWLAGHVWFARRAGSMKVDGQTVATYEIDAKSGTDGGICLDASGAVARQTNVMVHTKNNGLNQRWAFVPAALRVSTLPTPCNLLVTTTIGNKLESAPIKFTCNHRTFQARFRVRKRVSNASSYGDWSVWKSTLDGIGGNEGWADEWSPTLTLSIENGDRKSANIEIPDDYIVNGSSIVSIQLQVDIRACETTYRTFDSTSLPVYTIGNAASGTFTLSWKPTVETTKAELCGTGLRIYYTSDIDDGGCTVDVSAIGSTITEKGKYGASGYVLIPAKNLSEIPSSDVYVSARLTKDISSDYARKTLTVENANNHDTSAITYSESSYGTYLITISNATTSDNVQIFATVEGKVCDAHLKSSSNSLVYECVPPLGKEMKLLVWVERTDGTWDAESRILEPITDHAFVWTFDGGACVLDLATSRPGATQSDKMSRDNESYTIVGRTRPMYRAKSTITRDVSVTGIVSPLLPEHGAWNDFDALLNAKHATFRNQRGEVLNVFVSDIDRPLKLPEYTEVTVTQNEESR